MVNLPPVADEDARAKLAAEIRLAPYQDREDAAQTAYLAHIEGMNPVTAANTYVRRERRRRARHAPLTASTVDRRRQSPGSEVDPIELFVEAMVLALERAGGD